MNNLYDINIFNRTFKIDETEYKLLSQLYIVIDENKCINVLKLGTDNEVLLVGWDKLKQQVFPINISNVSKCIKDLKMIAALSDEEEIVDFDIEMEYEKFKGTSFLKLIDNISVLATADEALLESTNIEIEFYDSLKYTPTSFICESFDGLKIKFLFEFGNVFNDELQNWGILSPLKIYINDKSIGEHYVQRSCALNNERVLFLCQSKISELLNATSLASTLSIENMDIYTLSDFLVSTAGLLNSVNYPDDYPAGQYWFTTIIPITGVIYDQEFGIGNVLFLTKESDTVSNICEFNDNFNNYDHFALVHVNEEKMYNAFKISKKQIEQSIDLLVNVLKDDSLYSTHGMGMYFLPKNINIFDTKVNVTNFFYIENTYTNSRLSGNIEEVRNHPLIQIDKNFIECLKELNKMELLLIKANGTNDEEITPLFNALKWVRKAWNSENSEDKIIYAIIALEFIVSKEKNEQMLNKPTRKKCKNAIKEILKELSIPKEEFEKLEKNVCEKFDRTYTETPFMLKLRNLVNRLNIPIHETEFELIDKARKHRNGIIHGGNDSIKMNDIYKLCEVISKIAFYKINSLEV